MKEIIKDNKGYMLIEIIVASTIAFVMAYFLIEITVKLISKNNDYYLETVLLTDKNILTKEIMDDINSKKLIGVTVTQEHKNATLKYDDGTEKILNIDKDNKKISYGDYEKKLSDELNIGDITLSTNENILTISVPAYTNYSKEDYGIKIIAPYSADMAIVYPKKADIIVKNVPVSKEKYIENIACNGATATFDYEKMGVRILSLNTLDTAICSPTTTTKTKDYLNSHIIGLLGTDRGTGKILKENGYRYEGKNPNNYIKFNNELWRIIGVFDEESHGVAGQYLTKIIRNDSIGGFAWDGSGTNVWGNSSLYKILNNYYYNAEDGTESGYCYKVGTIITGDCDFTTGGINETYRPMVVNATWYTGGLYYSMHDPGIDATAEGYYNYERNLYDNEYYQMNKTEGHIGLMYASDYGYSVLGIDCARDRNLDSYDFESNCLSRLWLYRYRSEYTITFVNYVKSVLFNIFSSNVAWETPANISNVRPVLYLDSSVYILSGIGSKSDPYIISM